MSEASLTMDSIEQLHALFGDFDCNVNTIQKAFGVTIFSRGSDVKISGADEGSVGSAKRCIEALSKMYFKGDVDAACARMQAMADAAPEGVRAELEVNPANLY